jgi:predicted amidohydrolase
MKSQLCTAAIQFNIALGNIESNLAKARAGLQRAAAGGAGLAVLPEMWSTGYAYKQLPALAESTPKVLDELCLLAAELELVIVGSLPEKAQGQIFNTAYVIDRGQVVASYRKLHLFSMMREDRFLGAGQQTTVVDTSVGRLGLAICYDLRFPELFRKLALEGAEIICIPAEWPKPRQEPWRVLARARAIENQLFIAACNCCGIQDKLDFFGLSLLVSPQGEILAECGAAEGEILAIFQQEEMRSYRDQIRCFTDRRPDIYGKLP